MNRAVLAFASVVVMGAARAQDRRPFDVVVENGVERIAGVASASVEVGIAQQPAFENDGDSDEVRAALELYVHPATRFEWRLEKGKKSGKWLERAVSFPSQARSGVPSDVVTGVYFQPRGDGPFPAALILHHSGGSFEAEAMIARHLAANGVASLTIDMSNYGPRKKPGTSTGFLNGDDPIAIQMGFRQSILDARRAADFLRSRPEVDPARVGVGGLSLGAIVGSAAAGVDPRFARGVFVIGGGDLGRVLEKASEAAKARQLLAAKKLDPELFRKGIATVDPLTFAGRLRADDVLMLNATKDEVIPRESTDALWRRAGCPEIRWFECGHSGMAAFVVDILQAMLHHFSTRAPERERW